MFEMNILTNIATLNFILRTPQMSYLEISESRRRNEANGDKRFTKFVEGSTGLCMKFSGEKAGSPQIKAGLFREETDSLEGQEICDEFK